MIVFPPEIMLPFMPDPETIPPELIDPPDTIPPDIPPLP